MRLVEHPNVVRMLATKASAPDYLIVMPLAGSNLQTAIHEQGWRPDWPQVARTAAQMAAGISHLHAKGIVHRDIKPANTLLVGDAREAVITDLGISEYIKDLEAERADRVSLLQGGGKPTGGFHKKRLVGTLQYMPPEVLLKEPPTAAADAYAWAVTVNELATGTFPFADCTKDNPACHTVLEMGYGQAELAAAVASEGLRPLLRPDTPPALARLLEACWLLRPADRPSMEQVAQVLHSMLAEMASEAPNGALIALDAAGHGGAIAAVGRGAAPPVAAAADGALWARTGWAAGSRGKEGHQATVTAGAYATAGKRGADKMEDRHVVLRSAGAATGGPTVLGVFDGHRGHEAAEFMAARLEEELGRQWGAAGSPADALRATFINIDEQFVAEQARLWEERVARMGAAAAGERNHWPGCTALVAVVWGGRLLVANAGDCRAVLCRGGDAVQLTRDHCTADETERQRVIDAGGKVAWRVDSWRVGEAAIQVTRSVGDYDLRSHGLTPDPEITERELLAEDEFVVIASDGLFDVLRNEEVVGLVHDTVKEPSMCGQRLATEALTRGSGDNITVAVAFLQPVSTLESIYSNGRQKYGITPTLYGTRQEMLQKLSHATAADELQDMCY
mmetsp:Transcript_1029/g.2575  ORF Transcript_1029/g.2575 Transcript_1029/m.2575 type:complete len:622 (-) Transcript_1029:92-1957(-)